VHRAEQFGRFAIISLAKLAAALVIAEILLGFYYSIHTGTVFWTRPSPATPPAGEPTVHAVAARPPFMLSPYLGVVYRPGFSLEPSWRGGFYREFVGYDAPPDYMYWHANNYGFLADRDYPASDLDSTDFVVGIFGSSVAQALALDGRAELIAFLSRNPELRDRKIVVLNFAGPGGKPPQQALALAYFAALGQRFDLVINMDGGAGAFIAWENVTRHGIDPVMPVARLEFGLQNVFASSQEAVSAAATRRKIDQLEAQAAETRSALRFYWVQIMRKRYDARTIEIEAMEGERVPGRTYMALLNDSAAPEYSQEIDRLVEVWVRSSLEMAAITRLIGATCLQVLEPNPWFGGKPLSDLERERMAARTAPMEEIAPTTYRALQSASHRLVENGVEFVDATGVFDHHNETVYLDWCCHFNLQGYRILVGELLGPRLQQLRLSESSKPTISRRFGTRQP
jgi:hypothetical protein